jgi:succinate-acetate transporter protein
MDNMQEVRIPRQTLEKIYLNPPIDVKGDFRNILANPTPLGLVGFLVATLPMALQLMGLREGGEGGTATV